MPDYRETVEKLRLQPRLQKKADGYDVPDGLWVPFEQAADIEAKLVDMLSSSPREPQKDETKLIPVWGIDLALAPESPFEYDHGDILVVAYDDLVDHVRPREPHAALIAEIEQEFTLPRLGQIGIGARYQRALGQERLLRRCLLALKGAASPQVHEQQHEAQDEAPRPGRHLAERRGDHQEQSNKDENERD